MVFVLIKRALFGGGDSGDDKASRAKHPSLLPIVSARNHGAISQEQADHQYSEYDQHREIPRTNSTISGRSEVSNASSSSGTISQSVQQGGLVNPRMMSDIIIGLSDGLTVPFALTAGLSSLGDSKLVITGGLAELVSGAISMGLGGYLAAKSECEYYDSQLSKEIESYETTPENTIECINTTLSEYKLAPETIKVFLQDLETSPQDLIKFLLMIVKGLDEPDTSRQFTSALTIGLAYFFGGFIPLIPYFFVEQVQWGLSISVIVMAITLFSFGCIKTVASIGTDSGTVRIFSNGVKMVVIGGVAAAAAWGLVRAIE